MGRNLLGLTIGGKPFSFVGHFYETIDILGGWKGLGILTIVLLGFYFIVLMTITQSRQRRLAKKSN